MLSRATVIQVPKWGFESCAMNLPTMNGQVSADADKPRGVPRVNDRRVLNGIFWSYDLVRPGAICRARLAPILPATIVSFVGDGQVFGAAS